MILQKLVDEILVDFPELFFIGKYLKIRFKNRGLPCHFLSSIGLKIKNITKIEQNLLDLIIVEVYVKRILKCTCISKEKLL